MTEDRHIVSLEAINRKYKDRPFFATIPRDDMNRRVDVLGQNKSLFKNPDELSIESMLNLDGQLVITHRKLDITKDAEGKFERSEDGLYYLLLKTIGIEIVFNKKDAKGKETLFYIHDQNKISESNVQSQRTTVKLSMQVMELSPERMTELAIYLGKNPKSQSALVIEEHCLNACRTSPKKIHDFFDDAISEKVNNEIFVRKLYNKRVIGRRGPTFYYDSMDLGQSIESVAHFIFKPDQKSLLQRLNIDLKNK